MTTVNDSVPSIDRRARDALAAILEFDLRGAATRDARDELVCPETCDPAVLEIFRDLKADVDARAVDAKHGRPSQRTRVTVRRLERAVLFLRSDLAWPASSAGSSVVGALPAAGMLFGLVVAVAAKSFRWPREVLYAAFGVFAAGALVLLVVYLWVLGLMLFGPHGDQPESPKECWPFPTRASYERHRARVSVAGE